MITRPDDRRAGTGILRRRRRTLLELLKLSQDAESIRLATQAARLAGQEIEKAHRKRTQDDQVVDRSI